MKRYTRVRGAVPALLLGLTLTVAPGLASGTALAGPEAVPGGAAGRAAVQGELDRLTGADGAPGALAEVRDRRGETVLTSGVADLGTGAAVRRDSSFRIGSMTKMYVATVVLQLVGEHRVALDAPVERYLPGVVRGNGNDGRRITVRELLQHTSGLPDYLTYYTPQDFLTDRFAHHDRSDLLRLALAHPPLFEPGTDWSYSNTGYLLASMLIEKVTGHSYGTEIERRILAPLGLHATSVPGDATAIPGPHPTGYARPAPDAGLLDVTEFDPSIAAGSGDMISSGPDVLRFLDALVNGKLLRPAQRAEMMRTRPTDRGDGSADGLGLERYPLPCGGVYWGHGGDIFGFETVSGATADGREATVMVTLDPGGSNAQDTDIRAALTTALCS